MKSKSKPTLMPAMSFEIRIDLYDFGSEWKTETTTKNLHPLERFPPAYYLKIADALEARAHVIRCEVAAKRRSTGEGARA